MSKTEFQNRYAHYMTDSREDAMEEATAANKEGIDGDVAVVLKHAGKYCLMLGTAATFLSKIGVDSE